MSSIAPVQAPVQPAAAPLVAEVLAAGFVPGPPVHLTEFAQKIDRGLCRRALCGRCHVRGLEYRPFHQGRQYRVLAVCSRCGFAEDF